ncbi:MAG: O-antigen ligase family protein [Kyrpidia sp.]|nr:O-antigen ligase family protein [Kyrpidia sp.]
MKHVLRRSVYLEAQQRADRWITGVFLLLVALVPIIMRLKLFTFISPVLYPGVMGTGIKGDMFTYYKYVFLLIATSAAVLLFLYKMTRGRYEVNPGYINVPLLIVFLLVLVSGLAAPYKSLALGGDFSRFEGTVTYLCYFALFLIAANVEYTNRKADLLMYALALPVAVNVIISLMYFYGHDTFQIPWFRELLVPPGPGAQSTTGYLVTTLANPNYLSGFAAVAAALFWARAMWDGGRWPRWAADVVLAVLSFAAVLASTSTSGFATLVVIAVMLVVAGVRLRPRRGWLGFAVPVVAFVLVFAGMNQHNSLVWTKTIGAFIHLGGLRPAAVPGEGPESGAVAAFAPRALAADDTSSAIGRGTAAPSLSGGREGVPAGRAVQAAAAAGAPAPNAPDGVYLPPARTGAGDGRVYIWKRTLPMIAERPWLGHGLDTYMFYFPQDDPEKNSNLSDYNVIVDKPHNMYLGFAFGAGVPALAALLALFVLHAWRTVRTLWRRILPGQAVQMLVPLFAAWLAYLVQGLVNDSVIGVSAVAWVLFGVAVSVLRRYSPR